MGPIGSAVLTFIGYKQTNKHQNTQTDKQTDEPNLYIDIKNIKEIIYQDPLILWCIVNIEVCRIMSHLFRFLSDKDLKCRLTWEIFQKCD